MKAALRIFSLMFFMIIVSNVLVGCSMLHKDSKVKDEYTLLGKVTDVNDNEITFNL